MKSTYALTMNGRIHGELKSPDLLPEVELRRRIQLLDGVERYSLILWALPDGVPFDCVDFRAWPEQYIQTAGSRDRLMVEERQILNGVPRQFVIGHRADPAARPQPTEIVWDGCETTVQSNEVFDADEVAALFIDYYAGRGVSPSYFRRLIAP